MFSISLKREHGHEVFLPNSQAFEIVELTEDDNKFSDYQNKCRCCFEPFGISSMKVTINGTQRKIYKQLTGIELLEDPGYSKFFCIKCISDIKKCQEFLEKSKNLQMEFYEFVSAKIPIKCEDTFFETEVLNVNVDPPDFSLFDSDDQLNCTKECSVKLKRINLDDYDDVDLRYFEPKSTVFSIYDDNDNDSVHSFGGHLFETFSNGSSSRSSSPFTSKASQRIKAISRRHLKGEEGRMFCDKCDWNSISRKKMLQHAQNHIKLHKIDSLCNYCGKTLTSAAGLASHIKRCHDGDADMKKVKCHVCNTEVDTNFLLERHILWYHPLSPKNFNCGKCDKSFYIEPSLTRHDQLVHNLSVKCKIKGCEKMFYDNIAMGSHVIKWHKADKNLNIPCEICGKTYSSKKTLQKHAQTHSSDNSRRYKCETCGGIYVTAVGFRCHLVRHAKSEPDVRCEYEGCGKFFYTKTELIGHVHIVHKRISHNCKICGKSFRKPCFLREHVKVKHEGMDLKVPCPICGKTYPSKNRMVNHITAMHGEVQCTQCGETFSNASRLRHHQLTFHQNLRYRCVVPGCLKEYVRKAKVNDHFGIKHNDLDPEERDGYLKIMKTLQPT